MSQQNPGGGSSRRQTRDHDVRPQYTQDWASKEAVIQRELEEARARTAQMEKTMRWWSDCTANWREKWSKVRNERNKAREEMKQYKMKMEEAIIETGSLKTEKQLLEEQIRELKVENEKLLALGESNVAKLMNEITDVELRRNRSDDYRYRASLDSKANLTAEISQAESILANKLADMRLKLEETKKCLQCCRDEKSQLLAKVEALSVELQIARQDLIRQGSQTVTSNESNHSDVDRLQMELQDEIVTRQSLEERMETLKAENERLKSENAIQWSKRELYETENISILRENKKLYGQVCELKEQIHRLNRLSDNNFCLIKDQYGSDINVRHCPSSHTSSSDNKNVSCDDDELAIIENDKESIVSS